MKNSSCKKANASSSPLCFPSRGLGIFALLLILGSSVIIARAINDVPIGDPPPPDPNLWYCNSCPMTQQGVLSYTTNNILIGGSISAPTLISVPQFGTGSLTHGPDTYPFTYTNQEPFYFEPAFNVNPNMAGVYTFYAYMVERLDGPSDPDAAATNAIIKCGQDYTNLMATVRVGVWDPDADADYDGVCSEQEVLAGTDPGDPANVPPYRLGYWKFSNTNTWEAETGQLPLTTDHAQGVVGWDGYAYVADGSPAPLLAYREVEPDSCIANFNCQTYSVRLWFQPFWSSTTTNNGTGPGCEGRLVSMESADEAERWAILFNAQGTNISFLVRTNGGDPVRLFNQTINWSAGDWHQIVLTCLRDSGKWPGHHDELGNLYLDGQWVCYYNLIDAIYPGPATRTNGFAIGSDCSGANQAKGLIEELETFNYLLSGSEIAANYQAAVALDSDGDELTNFQEWKIGTDPFDPDSNGNGIPDGWEYTHPGVVVTAPAAPQSFQAFVTRPDGASRIP